MRILTVLLLNVFFVFGLIGQETYQVRGKLIDREGMPYVGVKVELVNFDTSARTGETGLFSLPDLPQGDYALECITSYNSEYYILSLDRDTFIEWVVDRQWLFDEIIVRSTRLGDDGFTAQEVITQSALDVRNYAEDIPSILDMTPSVVIQSDAGNGVGYSGLRIRGTDPQRTLVTINGVPLNDAESHTVFWVDLPDLVSSASEISVQRSVGSSSVGAGALGAQININTNQIDNKALAKVESAIGSFNTWKGSLSLSSGLLNDKYALQGRISKIQSDGYIDRASSELQSLFFTAAYVGDNQSLKFNLMSGTEETYQAWYGVPAQFINSNRTFNPAGMEREGSPHPNEVDNYTQNHYQLFYTHSNMGGWEFNTTLHYTSGEGFYEQYKANQSLIDYGYSEDTISDLVRRRWLDNDFYGISLSANSEDRGNGIWSFGLATHQYKGKHFGETIWSEAFGDSDLRPRYYDNDASKADISAYVKRSYLLNSQLELFSDLQYRWIDYQYVSPFTGDEKVNHHFINPKLGIRWQKENWNLNFFSGIAQKEPNRDDYVDNSSPDQVKPELLWNTEFGTEYLQDIWSARLQFYYMSYKDQLVNTGRLNDVGAYTRINVDHSYRAGVEVMGRFQLLQNLTLDINSTFSTNKVNEVTLFFDNWEDGTQLEETYNNTDLSFSPSVIAGGKLNWTIVGDDRYSSEHYLFTELSGKYVSDQFLDLSGSENARLDAYYYFNWQAVYEWKSQFFEKIQLKLKVNNLLDQRYSSNAWIYRFISPGYNPVPDDAYAVSENGDRYQLRGYYPQAGVHFMLGLNLHL